ARVPPRHAVQRHRPGDAMTTEFRSVEQVSSFRRLATSMWSRPRDPTIFGSVDLDATAALAFLESHGRAHDVKLTITHLVARAVALALRDQPELNTKVRFWGKIEQRQSVDVFV